MACLSLFEEKTPQKKVFEPDWLAGTSVGDVMFQVGAAACPNTAAVWQGHLLGGSTMNPALVHMLAAWAGAP